MQKCVMKLRWTELAAGNRNSVSMEIEVVPKGRQRDLDRVDAQKVDFNHRSLI